MASVSLPGPSDRRVVDELPRHLGLLPGEVDLLCQYFANVLDAALCDSDISFGDVETDDEM